MHFIFHSDNLQNIYVMRVTEMLDLKYIVTFSVPFGSVSCKSEQNYNIAANLTYGMI
jgi:hypothetical protein